MVAQVSPRSVPSPGKRKSTRDFLVSGTAPGHGPGMANSPHDTFFKRTFGRLDVAADHFRRVLPPALVRELQWSTLHREPEESHEHGQELRRDLLFSIRTHGGDPMLLYLHFEHQSSVVPLMALRIVDYEVSALRRWVRAETGRSGARPRHLPRAVAVVLYHGDRAWTAATTIEDLVVDGLSNADPKALCGGFHLLDLSEVEDAALDGLVHRMLALLLLKHIRARDLWERFGTWLDLLGQVATLPDGVERLRAVLQYLGDAVGRPPDHVVDAVVESLPSPAKEDAMQTWADSLRQEGHEEGRQEGREEGRHEMLVDNVERLLVAKFGPLDEAARVRVHGASTAQLEAWLDRILTAASLQSVLD